MNFDTAIVAFDTETTGLRAFHGDAPFAVSMCDQHGNTKYWDFPVDPFTRKVRYDPESLWEIEAIINSDRIVKVAHNGKFDVRMLELHTGIKLRGELHETMFAARACNSLEPNYRLKPLAAKYVDFPDDDEKDLQKAVVKARNQGRKLSYAVAEDVQADYWMPKALDPGNNLCETYARGDVERTILLWKMYETVMDELDVRDIYELERNLFGIAYQMEVKGVRLNVPMCRERLDIAIVQRDNAMADMRRLTNNPEFDPGNQNALRDAVYSRDGIEVKRFTPGGRPATSWKALIDFRDDALVHALSVWKGADKTASYYENYLRSVVGNTVHCSFNQSAAKTGRFSASDPPMQQVPKRANAMTGESPLVREPFGPRDGYTWYLIDYEQLELRILADLSQEPTLLEAIMAGRDVHSEVANKAWGGEDNPAAIQAAIEALELDQIKPSSPTVEKVWRNINWSKDKSELKYHPEMRWVCFNGLEYAPEVPPIDWKSGAAEGFMTAWDWEIVAAEGYLGKKDSRDRAKNVMYGMIYGAGADGLKEILRCSYDQASSFRSDINRQFPRIREYGNDIGREALRNDCAIRTLYGRRLCVEPDHSYKAINYMIQGSAADLLKTKMVELDTFLRSTGLDACMVLTVHDELVFEVRNDCRFAWLLRRIKTIMEDVNPPFGVPLPVEISRATESWLKKEKLKL